MSRAKYGSDHQRRRAELLPFAIGKPCPRCRQVMRADQDLDLGHRDDGPGYNGIEHALCNRSAGARKRERNRRARQLGRRSREW